MERRVVSVVGDSEDKSFLPLFLEKEGLAFLSMSAASPAPPSRQTTRGTPYAARCSPCCPPGLAGWIYCLAIVTFAATILWLRYMSTDLRYRGRRHLKIQSGPLRPDPDFARMGSKMTKLPCRSSHYHLVQLGRASACWTSVTSRQCPTHHCACRSFFTSR